MSEIDLKTLRMRVETVDNIPTIPGVLKKLLTMLENPKLSLNVLSNFISGDPALSSRVLRIVNSPLYGFPGRISSVSQAVVLLGINAIKGLLLGVSVFELMKESMVGLWEHSLGCACTARIIAKKKGLKEIEDASIAGLIHDIGKVILILQCNAEYDKALQDAKHNNMLILDAEKKYFYATHADAGSWITQKWNFPRILVEIIEYHRKPNFSKYFPVETAIVHLADIMVRAKGYGFAGDSFVPPVDKTAWELLALSDKDILDTYTELEDLIRSIGDISIDSL